jgi:Reverse transcriptase (RNA-dependent DNA polymerase)
MANWDAQVIDVKGAFLKGRFANDESLYLCVAEGLKDEYENDIVLRLQRTIYGLKQTAIAFWKELLTAFILWDSTGVILTHVYILKSQRTDWLFGFHESMIVCWLVILMKLRNSMQYKQNIS